MTAFNERPKSAGIEQAYEDFDKKDTKALKVIRGGLHYSELGFLVVTAGELMEPNMPSRQLNGDYTAERKAAPEERKKKFRPSF